jgi:hypothetical protein
MKPVSPLQIRCIGSESPVFRGMLTGRPDNVQEPRMSANAGEKIAKTLE